MLLYIYVLQGGNEPYVFALFFFGKFLCIYETFMGLHRSWVSHVMMCIEKYGPKIRVNYPRFTTTREERYFSL